VERLEKNLAPVDEEKHRLEIALEAVAAQFRDYRAFFVVVLHFFNEGIVIHAVSL
jgi:hypothetical protein